MSEFNNAENTRMAVVISGARIGSIKRRD